MASAAQRKVRNAFKSASRKCHATTTSAKEYGACVSKSMRAAGIKKAKPKKKVGAARANACAGLKRVRTKTGKMATVLRKGYTWKGAKGKKCPREA
jgi:hypothetical protein